MPNGKPNGKIRVLNDRCLLKIIYLVSGYYHHPHILTLVFLIRQNSK